MACTVICLDGLRINTKNVQYSYCFGQEEIVRNCDLTTLAPDILRILTLYADRHFEKSSKLNQDHFFF